MSVSGSTVRIYSPFFPFPVTEGAFQVIYDQARALASAGWSVELVTWKDAPGEIAQKLGAPSPVPFCEAVRITSFYGQEVRSLTAPEWRALPPSLQPAPVERPLSRLGRVAASLLTPWASPELFHYPPELDLRQRLPPADLGIYHYSFAYAWLHARGRGPEDRVCVHLHNLESELARLRGERGLSARLLPTALLHRRNAAVLVRHERELRGLADELWFVSARDLRRYRAPEEFAPLRLVPPTFDAEVFENRARSFASLAPAHGAALELGFIGSCLYEPNRASLEWIVRQLAPELKRGGFRGRILVVGKGVPETLRAEAEPYGFFEWLGFVPDLEGFWSRLSFLLIPEVGGSGVRIKLLEALASGVPVLANHAATQALPPEVTRHPLLTVRESPAEWEARIRAEAAAPLQTRRRHAAATLRGTSVDGVAGYAFLTAPTEEAPASRRVGTASGRP